MKPEVLYSLKLYISSFRVSNRLGIVLSDHLITHFYDLEGNSSDILIENFKKELSGISNENFKKNYDLVELDKSLNRKKRILLSLFWKIEEQGFFYEPVELIQSKAGSELYDNYIYQTNWLKDTDVKVLDFNKADLEGIFEKIIITAKEILKLEALKAIESELEFSDIFNHKNKVIADKVADACWIEMGNDESLSVEQLIELILDKYTFRFYKDLSDQKEKEKKIKKAIRERFKYWNNKLRK